MMNMIAMNMKTKMNIQLREMIAINQEKPDEGKCKPLIEVLDQRRIDSIKSFLVLLILLQVQVFMKYIM